MSSRSVSSVPDTTPTEVRHDRTTRSVGLVLACLLAMHAGPASAHAPEEEPEDEATSAADIERARRDIRVQEAERHYVEGMALFNRQRYREAAAEFERSYAAIPAARTLYSIGLSYERAGQTIPAIEACERYLALPDCSEPDVDMLQCAEQRVEVGRSVERLRRFVGELHLELAPGTELREVRVGGRIVPLDDFPVLLMPGPTEVELFGLEPEDHRVRLPRITAGETYVLRVAPFGSVPPPRLDVQPKDDDEPDRPIRDPAEERRRQQQLKTAFWAGLGLTAASGITAATLGGLTLRDKQRFVLCESPCPMPGEPGHIPFPETIDERFPRLRVATNAMIGVTAAFGVATVVLGALAFSRRDRSAQRANVRLTGPGLSIRF